MVAKIIFSAFFFLMSLVSAAQLREFHSLRKLPSGINSIGEESLPLLTPDGSRLYFSRAMYAGNFGGKFSGLDVWYSDSGGGVWRTASNSAPAAINTAGHNAIIGMSEDGSNIYFMSTFTNEKLNGIYITSRINNYWTRPEFVPVPGVDNQNFLGVHVSPDLEVMLISMKAPDSRGEEDLYFSVKNANGDWAVPRNMGSTLNTRGFEISPFLSADKKRLYFASNGHGGEGDADIFYSERLYNSWETWSLPVNLGKTVNSKKFDAYFSIYGDSIAYFASNRDGRFADIYEVKVSALRTVLKDGQQYLTRENWNRVLGGAVTSELIFPAQSSSLSASQKELVFYIANKLQLQKGIHFHLIAREEESATLTEARLNTLKDYFVQSGIHEERIITEQVEPAQKSKQGKIEIKLIE